MGRYKYSLNEKIKCHVEFQLAHYNEIRRDLDREKDAMMPSTVAKYGNGGGHGSDASRTTENVGLRMATSPYIRNLEQTAEAIGRVLSTLDTTDMRLVDLVYWKESYTVEGAAMMAGIGKSAAYARINGILGQIAVELGYVNT